MRTTSSMGIRDAWPAAAAFAVNGALYGGLLSRYSELAQEYGVSPGSFGAILTASALGGLTGSLLTPLVMRSASMAFAAGVTGVAYSLLSISLAYAPGPLIAGVLFFIVGVTDGGHDVSMNALTVKVQQRLGISIMGRAHATWSIALACGAAIGAAAASLGIKPAIHLASMAVLCTALQTIATRYSVRSRVEHLTTGKQDPPAGGRPNWTGKRFTRHPLILAVALSAIAASYIEGPAQDWSAVLLSGSFDATAGTAASAPFAFAIGLVTSRLSIDTLRRRYDPRLLASLSAGTVLISGILGYFATILGLSATYALLLFILIGLGAGPIYPMLFDTVGKLSRRYGIREVTTSSVISACSRLGAITAPAIVGGLAQYSGLSTILLVIAVAGMATAIALPFTFRNPHKPE